jgi:hypothetical protein
VQYPTNIKWFTGPLQTPAAGGQPRSGGVGQGALVGMYRPDGISDGANTIQGVRTTDSSSGTWTTPDVFAGILADPTSQKSYMWAGNNPVAYQDPSGYAVAGGGAGFSSGISWGVGTACYATGCEGAADNGQPTGTSNEGEGGISPLAAALVAIITNTGAAASDIEGAVVAAFSQTVMAIHGNLDPHNPDDLSRLSYNVRSDLHMTANSGDWSLKINYVTAILTGGNGEVTFTLKVLVGEASLTLTQNGIHDFALDSYYRYTHFTGQAEAMQFRRMGGPGWQEGMSPDEGLKLPVRPPV